ncbi:MAG: putative transporter ATP-binding protein [Acidimicrobiia bacterium]|nr:putative transporter ATP-binding protein [Acidimicrobiia bacterium]
MSFPDGTAALAEVTLAVAPGEVVAVVGPSGCGKSTLLRCAAGLETPSGGTVQVDRTSLGYVFQDPTLLPWRTVRKNVELLAELEGVSKAQRSSLVDHALAVVGLTAAAGQFPRQLSGGMRMRASLARTLVLDPSVVLFDEPFGALDEITRERLNDEVQALLIERGSAALFVTHSISEAVYLAHRVLVMSPAPGTVVAEVPVGLAFPRQHEVRYRADFAAICGEVSRALRQAHP